MHASMHSGDERAVTVTDHWCACILSIVSVQIIAPPALQQTVPPGGVPVCPLSTVQYTCVDDTTMTWRESGSFVTATYSILPPVSKVNDTAMAGSFRTLLTDISGDTLTSTATIDRVSLGNNGTNISCHSITSAANKMLRVQGIHACLHVLVHELMHVYALAI